MSETRNQMFRLMWMSGLLELLQIVEQ